MRNPCLAWILCLSLFVAGSPAWANGEKAKYKLGLLLGDAKHKVHDVDVLNAATDAFVQSGRFSMVERTKLDSILTEKNLQEFIGGKPNSKLSDLLGLDLVGVVGYTIEVTRPDKGPPVTNWILDVRLVDVKTASILTTVSSDRPGLLPAAQPRDAGRRLLQSVREVFPPLGYVVRVQGKEVVIDLGTEAGLKKGDTLEVVEEQEAILHPQTGQVLPAPLKLVGKIKVVSSTPQISICKVKTKDQGVAVSNLVRLQSRDTRIVGWMLKLPEIKHELERKLEQLKK